MIRIFLCFQHVLLSCFLKLLSVRTVLSKVQKYHGGHILSSNEYCQFKCADFIPVSGFFMWISLVSVKLKPLFIFKIELSVILKKNKKLLVDTSRQHR